MNPHLRRAAASIVLAATGRVRKNRSRFWGGRTGLRIALLHAMSPREFDRFRRIVDWCESRFEFAEPSDADALLEGRFRSGARDKLLFSFDDGHERDFPVAEWLARRGIHATFFVVPSYLDRTVAGFLRYHEEHGVQAHDLALGRDHDTVRGLSKSQVREMAEMGHRIAAHNHAHRDLGGMTRPADLRYEIDRALDDLSTLLEGECRDFAWGFGDVHHLSEEATGHLRDLGVRVYSSLRGLNVPGLSPVFLLRDALYTDGFAISNRSFLRGCADHLWEEKRRILLERVGPAPA